MCPFWHEMVLLLLLLLEGLQGGWQECFHVTCDFYLFFIFFNF